MTESSDHDESHDESHDQMVMAATYIKAMAYGHDARLAEMRANLPAEDLIAGLAGLAYGLMCAAGLHGGMTPTQTVEHYMRYTLEHVTVCTNPPGRPS